MNRRQVLEWLSRGLATAVAVVIGLPSLRYFVGGMQLPAVHQIRFQRLKRVQDLPVGRPVMVPVLGCKQDAWTRCDEQVVGRVWLVRDAGANTDSPAVMAFTSVCPHMGCQIQANASNQGFVCPCHRAAFGLNGSRQADPRSGDQNHAPRNMDSLECRIVQDAKTGDSWVEVKFEKYETGLERQVAHS